FPTVVFCLFSSPTPPPPTSTPFPYTTLFRSSVLLSGARRSALAECLHLRLGGPARPDVPPVRLPGARRRDHRRAGPRRGRLPHSDRKSTRLNSSHQIISYAVFCLKKKNLTVY